MPSASQVDLLLDASDMAVQQHFCKLFDVLMAGCVSEPEEALGRFARGLELMLAALPEVHKIIIEKARD